MDFTAPSRFDPDGHQRGADKLARIPIKVATQTTMARKPPWIRARVQSNPRVQEIKQMMRDLKLSSVCEEASCPNLGECFSHGTATFMIKVLVPDYRGRMEKALDGMAPNPPDVFNHNLETVPRLYKQCRPGSDYEWSLDLLENHKSRFPNVPTKSGLMLGLGETMEEIEQVMQDLRTHKVDMLTLGQYLQPSLSHLPVDRFVHPDEFDELARVGDKMGFSHVASGPMVRSSYHADRQAAGVVAE